MDSCIRRSSLSIRRKRPAGQDLRSVIAAKKAASLRSEYIGVIGAEFTGRNTLVRRFLHMLEGPFTAPEQRKYNRRTILVQLSERPYIRQAEVVQLNIHILNARSRSYEDFYQVIPNLKSIIMIYDVRYERTLNIATSCLIRMRQHLDGGSLPKFIMVGNKIDLSVAESTMSYNREHANNCGAEKYYECSALKSFNVDPVLDAILILTFNLDRLLPP